MKKIILLILILIMMMFNFLTNSKKDDLDKKEINNLDIVERETLIS